MAASRVLEGAAAIAGLKSNGKLIFGRFREYPVTVGTTGFVEVPQFVFRMGLRGEAVDEVETALSNKKRLRALGLEPQNIGVSSSSDPSVHLLGYTYNATLYSKPEDVRRILESLSVIAGFGGPPPKSCDLCGTEGDGRIAAAGGVPVQLCRRDLRRLRQLYDKKKEAVTTKGPDYRRAMVAGMLGMFIGSIALAGLNLATHHIFPFMSMLVALLIALLVKHEAGTVTSHVIVLMMAFTVLAIFLGDILWTGLSLMQQGYPFSLEFTLQVYGIWWSIGLAPYFFASSYYFGILTIIVVGLMSSRETSNVRSQYEVIA